MARSSVTAHPRDDGRQSESPRHGRHNQCRWEEPCMRRFTAERELRADVILSDPVDPNEDLRRAAERVNDGNIGLTAPGLVPGSNLTSDQALIFAQLYQRMCIVGVPGILPKARVVPDDTTWLELLFAEWIDLETDEYLDMLLGP